MSFFLYFGPFCMFFVAIGDIQLLGAIKYVLFCFNISSKVLSCADIDFASTKIR
jgi:hypothetical protein